MSDNTQKTPENQPFPTFPIVQIDVKPHGARIDTLFGAGVIITNLLTPQMLDDLTKKWREQRRIAQDIKNIIKK